MAEALRIELPAGRDQSLDLGLRQPALGGRQARQLDVLVADPAQAAQHGQGV